MNKDIRLLETLEARFEKHMHRHKGIRWADVRAKLELRPDALESLREMEASIELLSEAQYRALQALGEFDTKTSSWIETPPDVRSLGGALFCDRRYGKVFVYHNGAQSYYAARGFRGSLRV